MTKEHEVRQSFLDQADICKSLGSDFMHHLLRGLSECLDKSTECGTRILLWEGNPAPTGDALALRFAGGLHAMVRRGALPDLLPFYSLEKPLDDDFITLVVDAIRTHDKELLPFLDFAPQTNEVARASVIFASLLVIASKFNKPISLFELGGSAGLNLQTAQFGYDFGGRSFGVEKSPLQLAPEWQGSFPPDITPDIISRRGCDLNPLSVMDEADCEKLIAYLWPDQPVRIKRVEAAIEIAKQNPPKLDKADAADWVEKEFSNAGSSGTIRVLYHTIAQNYFPADVIDRIKVAMETAGEQATEESPLAWVTFEFDGAGNPKLILKTWPGSVMEVLAEADPHVYSIDWK